ncbi:hypothetical protein [Pseudobutyrivibrio xylanivorans]|uniref:Uncharacterized protein n=1 Tax=Pseudobutyrivibrio xylanivorans TaxID=185007 RepID=A0A5P6VNK0_PSEXY|nr:hypothetical protein [Pseudobutyrivibrio xylanivorans]QFJ54243.1 hypothetical protein FXF36_04850 [Pseudobutyrivibrio xylanivorans]
MKKVYDKVEVICIHKPDNTVVPLRFRLKNDDGEFETYTVSAFKPLPKNGTRTTKDGIYVSNSVDIFECKVHIFGLERTVRLYYDPRINNTWKLAV